MNADDVLFPAPGAPAPDLPSPASGAAGPDSESAGRPLMVMPPSAGGLLIVTVGESLGRLATTVRPGDGVVLLRMQTSHDETDIFPCPIPSAQELLDRCPFLEELGLKEETVNPELRSCGKAAYLVHRAALLERLRRVMTVAPIGCFAIVADAATGFGSTVLSELPIDLEALYARRFGTNPCILRIPVFPTVQGEELERMTLYALARELDTHARGTAEGPVDQVCENPYDALVLSDFQVGTPAQRRDELARFLGSLASLFRPPPANVQDNPLVRHKSKGPWRRGFRDLVALWKGGGWADFRYRRMLKEMEKEPPAPPLVDQEPFRAGRRLYLELDVRYRRLLGATTLDYPGRISPDDAGSLAELAEQLLEQRRDRDAFDAYRAATEARPDQPEHFEGLARAALLLGETEEALKNYTLTLQLDPDRAGAHEGLILCYLKLGRPEMARGHLALATASGCRISPELVERLKA